MSPSNTIRVSIFSRRLGGPVGKTVDPLSARHKKGPKFNTGPDEAIFLGDLSYILSLAHNSRWLHQMKSFSALLALCEMYPPEETRWFPSKRPVTRSFDVFFDLRLNKRLSKQSRHRWLRHHRAHYDVTGMCIQNLVHMCFNSQNVTKIHDMHIWFLCDIWFTKSL